MGHKRGNVAVLVAHVAVGQPLARAAAAAGMSYSTAQRRMRQPDVRALLSEALVENNREERGRFRDLRAQAMDRVGEILAGEFDPTVTLRAAALVFQHASTADQTWVFEELLHLGHQAAMHHAALERISE